MSRSRRIRFGVAILVGGAMTLAGCGSSTEADGSGAEPLDLAGRSFTSTEVAGRTLVTGTTVTLTFEDNQVSAQAGCNTIFGAATWEDGVLTAEGPLGMTQMGCEKGLAAQDEWLSEFLTSTPALSLDGDTLVVGDDTEGITLTEEG